MKKEEYMKKRFDKYKGALDKCFNSKVSVLSPPQLQKRISDMDNGDILNINTGNHAMLVCKESGKLYFYDPNDGDVGFGGEWNETSIIENVTKKDYMPSRQSFTKGHRYQLDLLKTRKSSPSEFVVDIDPKECPFITEKDQAFIRGASLDDLLPLILKDLYFKVCLQTRGGADAAIKIEIDQMSQDALIAELKVFCLNVPKRMSAEREKKELMGEIESVLADPMRAVVSAKADAGVLGPVSQGEGEAKPVIVELMVAYLNTLYKPDIPITVQGVCYGLSQILRELVVQTGSVQKAHNLFYSQMHLLKGYAESMDDRSKLNYGQMKELKALNLDLLVSMTWFFHFQQSVSVSGVDDLMRTPTLLVGRQCSLPMSVPMETQHRVTAEESGRELVMPSNPTEVYEILRELGTGGYSALVDSVTQVSKWSDDDVKPAFEEIALENPLALEFASTDLKGNREFVLEGVNKHAYGAVALIHASAELRADPEVVIAATSQSEHALKYASAELKRDKGVVLEAVNYKGSALQYASAELQADKEVVLAAVKKDGLALEYASPVLKRDQEVVIAAAHQNWRAFKYASDDLKKDPELIISLIGFNQAFIVRYASATLKENRKLLEKYLNVEEDGESIASFERRGDNNPDNKKVLLDTLGTYPIIVALLSLECYSSARKDQEYMLQAVDRNGLALEYASPEIKGVRDIVLTAVRENGLALEYADDDLKGDRELVLAAVNQNWQALDYASAGLQADRELMLSVVSQHGMALERMPSLQKDKEFVLAAVKQDLNAYMCVSKELKSNREVLLTAAKYNVGAVEDAPAELKGNRDFMLAVVKQNLRSLEYASKTLKGNRGFMLEALNMYNLGIYCALTSQEGGQEKFILDLLEERRFVISCASPDLQSDSEFSLVPKTLQGDRGLMLAALKINGMELKHALPELKKDLEVAFTAVYSNPEALEYVHEDLKADEAFMECANALIEHKKTADPDDKGLEKIAEAVETLGRGR